MLMNGDRWHMKRDEREDKKNKLYEEKKAEDLTSSMNHVTRQLSLKRRCNSDGTRAGSQRRNSNMAQQGG